MPFCPAFVSLRVCWGMARGVAGRLLPLPRTATWWLCLCTSSMTTTSTMGLSSPRSRSPLHASPASVPSLRSRLSSLRQRRRPRRPRSRRRATVQANRQMTAQSQAASAGLARTGMRRRAVRAGQATVKVGERREEVRILETGGGATALHEHRSCSRPLSGARPSLTLVCAGPQ